MCRFVLYLGPTLTLDSLITQPTNSLIHQSFQAKEREEPLNGDGFGVAWYAHDLSPEPAVFRSVTPAWNNGNLIHLARVTRSTCILAHVRAATQGLSVSETNCHPFTFGPYSFMHNGDVGRFAAIRRRLISGLSDKSFAGITGSTDSEHLFALFLDHLTRAKAADEADRMAHALRATVQQIVSMSREAGVNGGGNGNGGGGAIGAAAGDDDGHSYLNMAVSDGTRAVVSRFTTDAPANADSLHLNTGRRYVCEDGVCRMIDPEPGHGAIIVSSERLSDDPGWQTIPVNHFVIIHENRTATIRKWDA